MAQGVDGLDTFHPGQKPTVLTPSLRAKILAITRKKPADGSTVHRAWKEAGLKPHRIERYMASNDPELETKAADIIGLYLNPPQHAAVFCVDEKSCYPVWIDSIPFCRYRRDEPSAMALNTIATARSRFMRPWTPPRLPCEQMSIDRLSS